MDNSKPSNLLAPPVRSHGHTIYNIAVFHQMHCLYNIVKTLDLYRSRGHLEMNDKAEKEAIGHTGHCIDYIRASLLCSADTALEGQTSTTTRPGTLGEGSYHVCKDFDQVKAWAEKERASNMVGFGN